MENFIFKGQNSHTRSKEERYFLKILAAKANITPPEGLDWYQFYQLGKKHCLIPTLRPLLEDCHLPEQLYALFEQTSRNVTINNFSHRNSLCSILKALQARSIPCYPYKGPYLAELTQRLSERIFSDLDIIVPKDRVEEAIEVLGTLGYHPAFSGHTLKPFLQFHYEYRLIHHPSRLVLELKWRVTPDRFRAWGSVFKDWFGQALESYSGYEVRAPSNEELFVLLSVHGAKHLWSRIQWLYDLKELLALDLDWAKILEHAKARQAERALDLATYLISNYLGLDTLSKVTCSELEPSSLAIIAERIVELWFSNEEIARFERLKTQSALIDTMSGRCFFWLSTLLRPTPAEILASPIPLPHNCFYYLVRPLRYLCKMIGLKFIQDPRNKKD